MATTHLVFRQKYSEDKEEFQALTCKLEAIISVVQHYQKDGSMGALETRIKGLSPFVNAFQFEECLNSLVTQGGHEVKEYCRRF